jgi:hypothetical protein
MTRTQAGNGAEMSTRARIVAFGGAGLLVVAGALGAALIGGGTGQIAALVLIGVGLVAATSLVFFEVGLSEDRQRAREQQRSIPEEPRRRPLRTLGGGPKPRLERGRGQRRRLPRDGR